MQTKRLWIILTLILILGGGCTQDLVDQEIQKASSDAPMQDIGAGAPTFTEVTDIFHVSGAPVWLFAVNDGETNPALSTERDGAIYMGRLDLENPTAAIEWTQVVSSSDLGGSRVADHWHIFTHGYHWLAFSVQEANASYLLKLDIDFQRVSLTRVTSNSTIPTNDLFLVEDADGVTIGHFKPGYGHRLFRMNLGGELIDTIDIGGGTATHGNGASAYRTNEGFTVIAGRTLNYLEQGALYKLDYDTDWKLTKKTTLVDEDASNVSMTSGVELENGYLIVTARLTESYPRGELPPPKSPNEPLSDDGGSIVRFVFDGAGKEVSRTILANATTEHRPHMTLMNDLLITTWDGSGGSSLRIDEID